MKNSLCSCALLALAFLGSRPGALVYQTPTAEDLARQSTVIFKGQVEKTKASNVKLLPASDQTVLVRVDEVLYAAATMPELKGTRVTVQLKEAGSVKEGQQATFYTTGWLYGENIALQEVGHTSVEVSSLDLRKQISDFHAQAADEKVQTRIQRASMVVAGKVVATRRLAGEGQVRSNSEHDPDWWTAEVAVENYLKGQPAAVAPAKRVLFLFANSRDAMWFRSPKAKEGDEGIWILSEYKPGGIFPAAGSPPLVVLSPLDFHPLSENERIQKLVKAAQ